MAINADNYCFACGVENPIGLHLKFEVAQDKVVAKKILPSEFQGYEKVLHGGIIATMLDESMCRFIQEKFNEPAMTARLEIRYHAPTPIGQEIKISAWQESQRRNIIGLKSTVELSDGTITAEATAKFAVVNSK